MSDDDFQTQPKRKRPLSQSVKSPKKKNKSDSKAVSPLKKWIDSSVINSRSIKEQNTENKENRKVNSGHVLIKGKEQAEQRETQRSADNQGIKDCPVCGIDIRLMDFQVSLLP